MIRLLLLFLLSIFVTSQLISKNEVQIDCREIPTSLKCSDDELIEACNFTSVCDDNTDSKVQLTVLFSSFCYHSQRFITEVLYPKIYGNFKDHVEIQLVPFGNSNRTEDGSVYCKTGEAECKANTLITCANQHLNDSIPFVYCLESKFKHDRDVKNVSAKCYQKWKIDQEVQSKIGECENGDQGKKLQQIDADRTENTWPAWAESIPWLLFNNLSLASLQPDIIDTKSALCILYFNKNKFEACK